MAHDITDKVRKLLAKAERASTPAEAEAFTAKATDLMFRHQIDQATLAEGQEVPDTIGRWTVTVTGYAKQKATLLNIIGQAFDCKVIRLDSGSGSNTLEVFGWESDLETVKVLYASLELQSMMQAEAGARSHWEHARSFKTSFLYGFAVEVGKRLTAQRKRTREDVVMSSSTALALVDRSKAVENQFSTAYPRLRRSAPSVTSSNSGLHAGRSAGQRADLGGPRLAGARTALAR